MGRMGQRSEQVWWQNGKRNRPGDRELYKEGWYVLESRDDYHQQLLQIRCRSILFLVMTMAILWKSLVTGLGFASSVASLTLREVAQTSPTVTVKNGTYGGVYSPQYDQDFFLGIPYAQVGELGPQLKPS